MPKDYTGRMLAQGKRWAGADHTQGNRWVSADWVTHRTDRARQLLGLGAYQHPPDKTVELRHVLGLAESGAR